MPNNKIRPFTPHPAAFRLAATVAVVSGLFCLVVCVLLIANYLQIKAIDPINQPALLELRQQLAEAPEADPTLVQEIRAMDLLARKAFFTSQAHLRMGGNLLLGAAVLFLIALKLASAWAPRMPIPAEDAPPEQHWLEAAHAKEYLAFSAVALATISLLAAYFTPLEIPAIEESAVPQAPAEAPPLAPEAEPELAYPDWEAMQRQWPSFRGPGGYGVAFYDTAPTDWDIAAGKNIRWKVEVPLPGYNSPVVWDEHLLLSGATEEVREVYCFDTETGELRWKRTLPKFTGTPAKAPKVMKDTGHAASTMAVHGDLAFAIFANGDLVCYDFAGEQRWGRNLGVPENHYGHSSSLLAYGDLLFIQYDHKGGPKLIAVHAGTGEQAWVAERKKISWASPACIQTALGPQLILNSERDVDAYDPKTGRLLWTQPCLDGEVAPSPAYGGNTVLAANEYAVATAIRLDTTGPETKAEIAWEWDESLPEVASPVGSDQQFYITTSMGEIVCLDIATGENLWTEEFDEGFYSSPILVGERLYALDRAGVMYIVKAGPEFELIGSPQLGEEGNATPAYLNGRIYHRVGKHLLCIERQDDEQT